MNFYEELSTLWEELAAMRVEIDWDWLPDYSAVEGVVFFGNAITPNIPFRVDSDDILTLLWEEGMIDDVTNEGIIEVSAGHDLDNEKLERYDDLQEYILDHDPDMATLLENWVKTVFQEWKKSEAQYKVCEPQYFTPAIYYALNHLERVLLTMAGITRPANTLDTGVENYRSVACNWIEFKVRYREEIKKLSPTKRQLAA